MLWAGPFRVSSPNCCHDRRREASCGGCRPDGHFKDLTMLSKPIASGIMLTAIILLGGGALLQQDGADDQAGAVAITPEAETAPERAASAPSRVVDSAGFPAVPEKADADVAETRPIVTVNGRPLDGSAAQPA